MDYPNNPVEGQVIRPGTDRFRFTGGKWEKVEQSLIATVTGGVIDLDQADVHIVNLNGTATTLSIQNPLSSGNMDEFYIEFVITASTTVTWPAGFKWDGGTPPTLPTSGRAIIGAYTRDGGTRYEAVVVSRDSK